MADPGQPSFQQVLSEARHGDETSTRHQAHLSELRLRLALYDLNRSPIVCPLCQSKYVIASAPLAPEVVPEPAPVAKQFADPEAIAPGDTPEVETEALADIEAAEEPVAAEEDETFWKRKKRTAATCRASSAVASARTRRRLDRSRRPHGPTVA